MGHLFLDIETYQAKNNKNSSLNPYYKESKVILIAYNYYEGFKPPREEEIKQPIFLKEWEMPNGEKELLSKFYKILKEIRQNDRYLKFYGFNILSFDLPYLFGRMKIQKIDDEKELYDVFFRPMGFDMYQLSSFISENTKNKEQLWGMSQKETSRFFKLQVKEGMGTDCSRFYDQKEYDKIMKYCKEEFNFEQMLNAFLLHIIQK